VQLPLDADRGGLGRLLKPEPGRQGEGDVGTPLEIHLVKEPCIGVILEPGNPVIDDHLAADEVTAARQFNRVRGDRLCILGEDRTSRTGEAQDRDAECGTLS
jgi:hypothetical protein